MFKRNGENKMKTILVTGGAGFIGSNFVPYFTEKYPEYRIINLDKLSLLCFIIANSVLIFFSLSLIKFFISNSALSVLLKRSVRFLATLLLLSLSDFNLPIISVNWV
jgi:FlaA1/EpsC-like NDP-sugar epimerase